ncbi:MAG: RNA-binding cell elongation regulator Jag/EloR [Evtepia sp.]|uniref:RNA-binding cell elongation regulator Jag/EloR n=1 Tax=Evtepia sp. TaxID=2773933 RepID=UPI002A76556E|nr:RNA-binding cell elongation regulator Jag/EloR [Evtepia sp.]MDY3014314.1 RNA-binding cell elongation regulator Jag/EloR [Evtepia sp.]
MLKWIEATGKTEELAVRSALEQLGLDRDSVSVEILERARSGFLGFGSSPAKVKVTYEVPDEEPAPAPAEEPAAPPAPAEKAAPEKEQPAPTTRTGTVEERIRAFLTGLLAHMEVEAEIHISPKEDNSILVTLEGSRLGALIGHRGETLDAIQQLTNYSVNRGRSHRVRIHIDAENYRAKREESLKRLANKVAAKVVKYRRNITLEPMNAYERHVIHETLQDYPDVITYSTGTEPNRRTVVAFSRGKHVY